MSSRDRVLAIIMAGGSGGRLEVLTDFRAKPAIPYAGVYRLIDFPLSNCLHSGLSDVWIAQQYQPQSLNDHLSNGRPWDLDRTYGGLRVLQPYQGREESGWHQGNADALYRHKQDIQSFDPDVVIVLSADHVYKLDYQRVIDLHKELHADVTMVTKQVPLEQASDHGVVQVGSDGRVTGFEYKPESPSSDLVTTEVFAYDPARLLATLDQLAEEDGELQDFGHGLLPRLVEAGNAYEYRLDGYWMDVGTPIKYWRAHMDLLVEEPELDLDDAEWPVLTVGAQRNPAWIHASAHIDNSLISPGGRIRGEVVNSVLSPGVTVEAGASIRDSVILDGAVIEAGATITGAIVDRNACIGRRASVGGSEQRAKDRAVVALVGQAARVEPGSSVPADGRVSAGTA
ncbi:MAG: glucose-1-phosphate adenylyltransferase [Chloroflexota bacterium]|nr:glucose-1-phosphate adenylyltransferase [Chloroflexota bacterium]